LVEIINNNPEEWKSHPLTHIKVYRMAIQYIGNQEIRTFYNKANERVKNIRDVYKEVYTYDANRFKTSADFYDLNNQQMNSNWNIARYTWEKHNGLIIEHRYNTNGEPVNVSPYFSFGTIGILLDEKGFSKATFNLNDKLEIVNNEIGIACYQDTYDDFGNHIAYTYIDQDNRLTKSAYKFAFAKKYYDSVGNMLEEEYVDINYKHMGSRKFKYDGNGYLIK
jgi:hypothetical protein